MRRIAGGSYHLEELPILAGLAIVQAMTFRRRTTI
jgi:hypothetical protein